MKGNAGNSKIVIYFWSLLKYFSSAPLVKFQAWHKTFQDIGDSNLFNKGPLLYGRWHQNSENKLKTLKIPGHLFQFHPNMASSIELKNRMFSNKDSSNFLKGRLNFKIPNIDLHFLNIFIVIPGRTGPISSVQ